MSTPAHSQKALSLPDELWINILLQLDYFQLKKVTRVSKMFKRFIQVRPSRLPSLPNSIDLVSQDPEFDKVLFRAPPPSPPLPEGESLTVHPVLEATECIVYDLTRHYVYGEKKVQVLVKDLSHLLDETATSPASAALIICLPASGTPRTLHRKAGVTINDVLVELERFWNSKPYLPCGWEYYDNEELPRTMIEALCERNGCGIGGWDECVAIGGNCTNLAIDHSFDS